MNPTYILEEKLLRRNLQIIHHVAQQTGAEIILAFKAYALWKTFPIFRQYIHATTASSPYEAQLAVEKFGAPAHTYSPAYTDQNIQPLAKCSSHLTFNSLSQAQRYAHIAKKNTTKHLTRTTHQPTILRNTNTTLQPMHTRKPIRSNRRTTTNTTTNLARRIPLPFTLRKQRRTIPTNTTTHTTQIQTLANTTQVDKLRRRTPHHTQQLQHTTTHTNTQTIPHTIPKTTHHTRTRIRIRMANRYTTRTSHRHRTTTTHNHSHTQCIIRMPHARHTRNAIPTHRPRSKNTTT